MEKNRSPIRILKSVMTSDGAGVRLKRVFGFRETELFDPFLLLDSFGSDDPSDYIAGFPWHPHRGIETVTYMIDGEVEHGDSLGNKGTIHSGEVQWMTSGSGIIHQEMPKPFPGTMRGFQLWVNLPKTHKMTMPRYRDIHAGEIPRVNLSPGVEVRVICGDIGGVSGPVTDIMQHPLYLDVSMKSKSVFTLQIAPNHTAFAYVFEGNGDFGGGQGIRVNSGELALFSEGLHARVASGEHDLRFLLIAGEPVREPVAWRGPIVMNTNEELDIAFREFYEGSFIKNGSF